MKRLNKERQDKLEPLRMQKAIQIISDNGYKVFFHDSTTLQFIFNNEIVTFYPYSGWHTGKSIIDGRGLENLLSQIKLT